MAIGRRRLLLLSLGAAGAWIGGEWSRRSDAARTETVRRSWALGAPVQLTIRGLAPAAANRAIDAALEELETVEQVMSLYRPDSQVCRLNRERRLDAPHPCLLEVLAAAERTARLSDGAFDVTVQPLWRLFQESVRASRPPSDEAIARARGGVDWRGVRVAASSVALVEPVEAITLNGIAQGFATDRVRTVLQQCGVEHALIDAGEFRSLGEASEQRSWRIGIRDPRDPGELVSQALLDGRAVATSGDYESTFSADFRDHHIFDPRTGRSPTELASATIVAPTALEADALSTAAMVLGSARFLELAKTLDGVDALFVDKQGGQTATPGFPAPARA